MLHLYVSLTYFQETVEFISSYHRFELTLSACLHQENTIYWIAANRFSHFCFSSVCTSDQVPFRYAAQVTYRLSYLPQSNHFRE